MTDHEEERARAGEVTPEDRDSQPLARRRILVTRAQHQASELADRLRALGGEPILIPTIEIAPPSSFAALDAALAQIDTFDLVTFTSANAVSAFAERAERLRVTPAPHRVAAVGPSTAKALAKVGLRVDIVPPVFTADRLGEQLRPEAKGRNLLLVLAEDAPATLQDALISAGAHVTCVPAYANRLPAESLIAIRRLFAKEPLWPHAITFTSASTARNLAALLEAAGIALPLPVVRASIGPITSRALAEIGLPPQLEARESTIAGLVEVLAAHFTAYR